MILNNWGSTRAASSTLENPAAWLVNLLGGGVTSAGKTVTESNSLSIPTVYACCRILSEAIGMIPMPLYRRTADGKDEARRHPLWRVMNVQANREMTAVTWQEISQLHRSQWGNSYSVIVRNVLRGEITELIPLAPDVTQPKRIDGEIIYETVIDGNGIRIPSKDILHIKGLGFDGLVGWSPIRVQMEQAGLMLAQQEFAGKFYKNGANIGGVLTHPGRVKEKDAFIKDWQRYQGSDNAMNTAILEQGMQYERIGIPPNEAQFIETQKLNSVQIATIYGVPPHRINILDRVTFNNMEQLGVDFVQFTLVPWFRRIEQECAIKLLRPQDNNLFFRFNANALMRGDFKTRTEGYGKALGGPGAQGWMTINEVRNLEDMNPVEGGDDLIFSAPQLTELPPDEPEVEEVEPVADIEEEKTDGVRGIVDAVIDREVRRVMLGVASMPVEKLAEHWSVAFQVSIDEARLAVRESARQAHTDSGTFDEEKLRKFLLDMVNQWTQ